MAFCPQCGVQVADDARFCPKCGAALGAAAGSTEKSEQTETSTNSGEKKQDFKEKFTNTPDTTADFDAKDIEDNKVMGVLAYLGILVLVPILAAKKSKFARFHANQGLLLCLVGICFAIAYYILGVIFILMPFLLWLLPLVSLVGWGFIIVLCIIGIVNVVNSKAKELPFFGKYRIIK